MNPFFLIALAAAPQTSAADPADAIVVTGSREAVRAEDAVVSATLFDRIDLEALAFPLTSDVLRLTPGVSVAASGPRGTQTQVRIRGAEANHSLLFVDGIRFNDPAAGNEARFELLTNDALSRVEIVRGPQSALWGSEALGGVIAVESADPWRGAALSGIAEYGGQDSKRAAAQAAITSGAVGLSGGANWLRSDGIDSFGQGGDRDGFETKAANVKAVFRPLPASEFGLVAHWIDATSEFDGIDLATFQRADTSDRTDNTIFAARAWASTGGTGPDPWALTIDASLLDSSNRNVDASGPLNSSFGRRFTVGGQASKTIGLGTTRHLLTGAAEYEGEDFATRDQNYLGATDQDRSRELTAWIGEWRADWTARLSSDVAVRHDDFSDFASATTLRASALFKLTDAVTLHGGYGEGIAQPTFFDLHGFFPGLFAGNPDLRPERSEGWEAGVRWSHGRASAGITGFTNRLTDEIVETFDPVSFVSSTANGSGTSHRRGIELDARYRVSTALSLAANYSYLDADERKIAGSAAVRELRRPRHSANLIAQGIAGPVDWSGTLVYVGQRDDTDFDFFPGRAVKLDDYLLASFKVGWRLTDEVEAYARVENAFDVRYQDVVGYNTPGRTVYAGLRLRLGA